MSEPRIAYCLFCEDIREEVGHKQSYMGVQEGEMVAAIPPGASRDSTVALPKLVIIVWLTTDFNDVPERATVTISAPPGRSVVFRSELDIGPRVPRGAPPEWASRFVMRTQIPFQNFIIAEDGVIEVVLDTQREMIVAGRLRVRLQWPRDAESPAGTPTASEPPSEQSLPAPQETKPSPARRRSAIRRTGRTPARG